MKDKAENPQAFPSDEISQDGVSLNCQHQGMTLRDYFAAKALQGLCAGRTEYEQPGADAKLAYELADHMLNERNK